MLKEEDLKGIAVFYPLMSLLILLGTIKVDGEYVFKKICILDYGSGNSMSVYNAIKFLNYKVTLQVKLMILKQVLI